MMTFLLIGLGLTNFIELHSDQTSRQLCRTGASLRLTDDLGGYSLELSGSLWVVEILTRVAFESSNFYFFEFVLVIPRHLNTKDSQPGHFNLTASNMIFVKRKFPSFGCDFPLRVSCAQTVNQG